MYICSIKQQKIQQRIPANVAADNVAAENVAAENVAQALVEQTKFGYWQVCIVRTKAVELIKGKLGTGAFIHNSPTVGLQTVKVVVIQLLVVSDYTSFLYSVLVYQVLVIIPEGSTHTA